MAGQVVTQIEVEHASADTKNLDLILEKNIETLINNSVDIENLTPEIKINDDITAPISANEILGTATYTVDGLTYTTNLLASHDVEATTYLQNILKVFLSIFILIIVYELMYSKKKRKNKKKKNNKSTGKYLYGRVKY